MLFSESLNIQTLDEGSPNSSLLTLPQAMAERVRQDHSLPTCFQGTCFQDPTCFQGAHQLLLATYGSIYHLLQDPALLKKHETFVLCMDLATKETYSLTSHALVHSLKACSVHMWSQQASGVELVAPFYRWGD